ncbi:MAG: protein kinase [Deltaproteobacteria bacterium]|nr:protein kinase [Deltaproteobacteria bacterium]
MVPIAPLDARVLLGTILKGTTARYYVQAPIGEGGQGWVFRASYDDAEGFPVVIKVLRPDSATRDALDRFRREADILKRLSQSNPSPFIVRFYDHGEANFPLALSTHDHVLLPFTVMEYVHGESLHEVIDRQRGFGLALRRTRRILKEIRAALEIVHAQGLIHRDLKPSNILISNEAGREVAKVTDFGLVKVIDLRATATQSLAGVSLSYAPPEQYEPGNPRVGPATDVFSYGAIVFELLTGSPAYPATSANPFEALRRIGTGNRMRLAQRTSTLPLELQSRADIVQRLDAYLDRMLAPEPEQRPQSITAVWEQIDAMLREAEGVGPVDISAVTAVAGTMPGHGTPTDPSGSYRSPSQPPPPVYRVSPSQPPPPQPALPARAMGTPPIGAPGISQPIPGHRPHVPLSPPVPSMSGRYGPRDPADLRAWSFRVLSHGNPGALVRDVTFSDDLREVLTLGNAGLVQWSPSGWSSVALPIGLAPNELRAMTRLAGAAHACVGEGGLVAFLHGGALWDVRRYPDPDVVFHGVAADPAGQVVFAVGARASRGHAIIVEALSSGWRRTFEVPDLGPLRGVAFLDDRIAFACGDGGALVRVDDTGLTRIAWERSGHLRAIVASPSRGGGASVFAVGTGGHALSVQLGHDDRTDLEKVGTTQDLLDVALAADGAAWTCSANARVLRRDVTHAWRRVPVDLPVQTNLVRIAPRLDRLLTVGEDASVIEGTLG